MRARVILVSIAAAAIGTGCMAPLLEPLEPQLVFRPRALAEEDVKALAGISRIEEVRLATTDGLRLHGWLKRPERWTPGKPHRLVIVYGGVGQEISEFVSVAHARPDWGWLTINYRGFGLSEGSPSERAVLGDAKIIYDWATARPDIDAANIVVLGRSLGTYVAIAVAAARKVRAAILATPFDSAAALGEEHYRVPLGWLVQSRYNPALIAPMVSAPALFLLAEKDEVTPVKNGLALARRWGGLVKTVLLPGAGHRGVENREEFWASIGEFLAALDEGALTGATGPSAPESSTGRSSAR
ncbi:MAG TPA: alpha/beta hydrolase [Burkholderiales bacterium]|nr:alpha/beta hydrolase [Burkholderiales bacterium]